MTELKLNHKPLTEVTVDGTTYPVAVTLQGERNLKAKFGKTLEKLIVDGGAEAMGAMFKELVAGGCKVNQMDNPLAEKSDEFFEDIIDQQPELYGNIIATYNAAIEKRFSITRQAEAGNS